MCDYVWQRGADRLQDLKTPCLQVILYLPYPYYRPRMKVLSMRSSADAPSTALSQQEIAECEAVIESSVYSQLPPAAAAQSVGYLVGQTLLSMESLRTRTEQQSG